VRGKGAAFEPSCPAQRFWRQAVSAALFHMTESAYTKVKQASRCYEFHGPTLDVY
jgi:hypothetical protein